MKVPCLEKVERIAIACLFHYIKLEDMRAISAKCHTFVMHFCVCLVTQFHFVISVSAMILKTKQRETT